MVLLPIDTLGVLDHQLLADAGTATRQSAREAAARASERRPFTALPRGWMSVVFRVFCSIISLQPLLMGKKSAFMSWHVHEADLDPNELALLARNKFRFHQVVALRRAN
jgi:hypothetical protein